MSLVIDRFDGGKSAGDSSQGLLNVVMRLRLS